MIEFIWSQVDAINLLVIFLKIVVILVFLIYNKKQIGPNTSSSVCVCEQWERGDSESPLKNSCMTTETSGYRSKDKGIKTIYVPLKGWKARYCGCLSDNCAR